MGLLLHPKFREHRVCRLLVERVARHLDEGLEIFLCGLHVALGCVANPTLSQRIWVVLNLHRLRVVRDRLVMVVLLFVSKTKVVVNVGKVFFTERVERTVFKDTDSFRKFVPLNVENSPGR